MHQIKPGRIRELDGWRGVSILLVLLQHLVLFAFPESPARPYGDWVNHVAFASGGLGVRIFFTISGFVITRLLLLEEAQRGHFSLKGFYIRRLFRILPVFYGFLLVVWILSRLGWTPTDTVSFLRSGLFLHDLRSSSQDWFLGHSWSLAVEEQFYLAFPPLLVLVSVRRRPQVLLCLWGLSVLWSMIIEIGHLGGIVYDSAIIGFSCISVGALMAFHEQRAREIAQRLHPLLIVGLAVFLIASPLPKGGFAGCLYVVLVPSAIGFMLMYTMSRKGWASAILNTTVLQWIGLISYSLYLWQEIFTGPAAAYGSPRTAGFFHLALIVSIPVAAMSFYWVERPTARLGRRLSATQVATGVPAQSS